LKAIEILLKQFETFIKRSIVPSISIVFVFIVEYFLLKDLIKDKNFTDLVGRFSAENISNSNWIFLVVCLIGLSYFLSILHQLVFDNLIKENYDGWIFKSNNKQLTSLRTLVITKVKKKIKDIEDTDFTDFFLYQIIGRELIYFNKPSSTSRYVDDTKSIGIFALTIIFVNIIFIVLILKETLPSALAVILLIILSIVVYGLAFIAIRSKYRSRAIRIYTNYLLGEEKAKPKPPQKENNTISLKIEK